MKAAPILAIIALLLIPLISFGVYRGTTTSSATPTATPISSTNPTTVPSSTPFVYNDPANVATAHKVKLSTSMGDIIIDLYPEDAPHTVKNFVTLGSQGYYNNIIFHRVIKDFVIQGGDPTGTGTGGTSIYGAKFPDEINSHKIVVGSLAMANSGPNTNGSQFFIVTASAQPSLDGSYTNFGQVESQSMSVVTAIAAVPVNSSDKPLSDVKMTGFQILEK